MPLKIWHAAMPTVYRHIGMATAVHRVLECLDISYSRPPLNFILFCSASTGRLQPVHPSSQSLSHSVRLWRNLQRAPFALAPFPLEIALWMVEGTGTPFRDYMNAPWEPLNSQVPRPAIDMHRDAAIVAHQHR